MECAYCGKEVFASNFCDISCEINWEMKRKKSKQQKQKFEEIKEMAWEIYKNQKIFYYENQKAITPENKKRLSKCWLAASMFYNYAKEKEEEVNNES